MQLIGVFILGLPSITLILQSTLGLISINLNGIPSIIPCKLALVSSHQMGLIQHLSWIVCTQETDQQHENLNWVHILLIFSFAVPLVIKCSSQKTTDKWMRDYSSSLHDWYVQFIIFNALHTIFKEKLKANHCIQLPKTCQHSIPFNQHHTHPN